MFWLGFIIGIFVGTSAAILVIGMFMSGRDRSREDR